MNENTEKKLSRRDALKALGAALGGTALAALPPAWSKPALAASELPEHARQSEPAATEEPVATEEPAGPTCPIVRTVTVGMVSPFTPDPFYIFNEGPITADEIANCAVTQIEFAWTGSAPTGGAGANAFLARSSVLLASGGIWVPVGTPSPVASIDPLDWTDNEPYNGIWINPGFSTWNVGTMTVTLS